MEKIYLLIFETEKSNAKSCPANKEDEVTEVTVKFLVKESRTSSNVICRNSLNITNNYSREGQPKLARTDENVAKIHDMILDSWCLKVNEIH